MKSSRQVVQSCNTYQPGANGGIKDEEAIMLQSAENNNWHYDAIVLNIPHASVEGIVGSGWPQTREMWQTVRKWTDWFTDYLFASNDNRIKMTRMNLSRFIVDVERLIDDPLEKRGEGIVYSRFGELLRSLKEEETMQLMQLYNAHQQSLRHCLTPGSLLIDCHSFPSELSDVDVCIGTNDDWSCPPDYVLNCVRNIFEINGYSVGINTPYSNSITPVCDFQYHSFMIELNKRIYMDEGSLMLKPESDRIKEIIQSLYTLLLKR